jgi:DHA3 family macrolide efflux protein-like MFS transporter
LQNLPPLPRNWAARFFTIWIGQNLSLFGSAVVQFALIWWLTRRTGSATVLATATLAGLLPQIILGPLAGALVDRYSRRLIMILADGAIALATLILIWLFAIGRVEIWHVYGIMAVRSLGGAFHFPAMTASTPLMVPEKHLTRVSGLNQTLQGLINLAGPVSGALLIGVLPTQGVLLIDVGTAGLAILPLLFLPIPQPPRKAVEPGQPGTSLWQEMQEGFRYVRSWPGLLAILVMATVINFLLTPASSLLPLLVTRYFHKGALELGLTDSAWGLGIITGGILLGIWGGFKRKIATSMMGITGIGLGITIVGIAPASAFPLALAGMALGGFMNPITNGPLIALFQTVIPPEMQGRVNALVNSAASAMTPLGLLIAGPVSDAIGVRAWYWISGLLCLLMGLGAFFVPAVMNIETNRRAGSRELAGAGPAAAPAE